MATVNSYRLIPTRHFCAQTVSYRRTVNSDHLHCVTSEGDFFMHHRPVLSIFVHYLSFSSIFSRHPCYCRGRFGIINVLNLRIETAELKRPLLFAPRSGRFRQVLLYFETKPYSQLVCPSLHHHFSIVLYTIPDQRLFWTYFIQLSFPVAAGHLGGGLTAAPAYRSLQSRTWIRRFVFGVTMVAMQKRKYTPKQTNWASILQ